MPAEINIYFRLILHFEYNHNICLFQVKSSGQMEVAACERLLKYLLSTGMKIRVFATDRSTSIRTLMAKEFPQINHQFDLW